MTMDPGQLSWMQDATQGMMPGGQFSPHPSGGAGYLAQLAQGYSSPIQGNALPDTSPLAPLNLQQYGIGGMLAGAVQPGAEAAGKGITLIAAQGDTQIQAQSDSLQIAAKQQLSIMEWAIAII